MAFLRRILLFFAINALVIVTISLALSLFGVRPFLQAHGVSYGELMIFCAVWGFGGALISLALSRVMAKWIMKVKVIDPKTAQGRSKVLLDEVYSLARSAGLDEMPQVGIYASTEVNAFATGPSRRRSLVAVSQGLVDCMSGDALRGVLAHEITHIANGDMVTMTLVQGVINAFVMFLARVLALGLSGLGNQNNRERGPSSGYYVLVTLFEIVFMLLGMLVIAAYSRYREFRADRGGARLVGVGSMIAALEALGDVARIRHQKMEKPTFDAMKISVPRGKGFRNLFATHPPLGLRVLRLRSLTV